MNPYEANEDALGLVPRIVASQPSSGTSRVVAIDGCGGSGKSTLAGFLAARLPGSVIVHTDDFASWDNPLDWWPRLRDQVLEPLSHSQVARYQRYDWGEQRLMEWHEVSAPIVILEGVSSSRREFFPYLAFKVFVACPRDVRLQRGLARDGQAALPLWEQWMAAEDDYLERDRPIDRADAVIDGLS